MTAPSSQARQAALIVNTRSRHGERSHEEALALVKRSGLDLRIARTVDDPEHLPLVVIEALQAGCGLIILGGGDGTVSCVAGLLADSDATLAVLPLGTANSFARSAGLPLDLAEAVEVALHGREDRIDLGRVGERCFVNAAAVGLPIRLSQSTPHWLKRVSGRLSYALVGLARIIRYRGFRCTLACDGLTRRLHVLDLRIANGSYQGGIEVADQAEVDSGHLVVQVVEGRSTWPLLGVWLRWLAGRRPGASQLRSWRAREILIDADPGQLVAVDGEVVDHTPVQVRVAPKALRLMRPPA